MKCHKCSQIDAIKCGEYDHMPWKEIPCAQCKLGEDTFYSVPFDEEHPPENIASDYTGNGQSLSVLSSCGSRHPALSFLLPVETLVLFVQGWLSLDSVLRDIVAWRYQGVPYKEIARRQGTSIQLAEMRHKRALRDWPALESLFPEKVAKQSRRKSRR